MLVIIIIITITITITITTTITITINAIKTDWVSHFHSLQFLELLE